MTREELDLALDPTIEAYRQDLMREVVRLSLEGKFVDLTHEQVSQWIGNLAAWFKMKHGLTMVFN